MSKDPKIKKGEEQEIRPVTPVEAQNISDKFTQLALGIQTFGNGLQRQISTNLATISLLAKKNSLTEKRPSLTSGLASRFAYQGIATYPSLQVRKILTENGEIPQYAVTLVTTGVETTLGTPLETHSLFKTLRSLGIKIGVKDLATTSSKAFFPFYARNVLGWWAINRDSSNTIGDKFVNGVAAGVLSTPFNNIGIKAIEHSLDKNNSNWTEFGKVFSWEAVVKDMKMSDLFKGWHFRGLSIGATAVLLSPDKTKYIAQKCDEGVNYISQKIFGEEPSASPKKVEAKKAIGLSEKQAGK